jgi:hypothetical protein
MLSYQITALIAYARLVAKSQAIIERTGVFRARQCHGRGMSTRTQARNAPTANSGCAIAREVEAR